MAVRGIVRRKPPILRMSVSSCVPCITLPAPRKSIAFDTPCATRWKMAAASPNAPSESIISPRWLIVEYARARLMSVITSASVPAYRKVIRPMMATTSITTGTNSNMGSIRATR